MTLSKSTYILEELQKQQVNLGECCEPFVIEASGRLEIVRSPYSPIVDDVSLTLHEPCYDNGHSNAICKDPSFHASLPSSTISQSVAMLDERLFDGLATENSFNGSFSGTTELSDAARVLSFVTRLRQMSNDMSWKHNTLSKEDELMLSTSKDQESQEQEEEDSGFSVMSHHEEDSTPTIKRRTNAGNIMKRSRRNHDAKQTTILMDWYLQHDGKTPDNQGKLDLAKATNLNVVQVSTWFQNRKRRYLGTLHDYQALSKRRPELVYSYQSYKSFIASKKSSHKKTRK